MVLKNLIPNFINIKKQIKIIKHVKNVLIKKKIVGCAKKMINKTYLKRHIQKCNQIGKGIQNNNNKNKKDSAENLVKLRENNKNENNKNENKNENEK